MNNQDYDPWDDVQLSPDDTVDIYKNKPESEKDPWDDLDFGEGFWTNAFRTAMQIPQGIAEATKGGITAGIWHLLGQGEVFDPESIDHIREISKREGIPFDEEAYMEAGQKALGSVPTVSNIASKIEEKIGLPLEPKTKTQKFLRLGSMAAKFQPGSASQKTVAGIVAPSVSQGSQAAGLPEPFADILGLGVGAGAGAKTSAVDVKFGKTKPSGLPERGFEKLKEPTEVPSKKIQQINDKLQKDFQTVSNEIIKDSPIGETAENLKNDPRFKRESKELLDQAQILANDTPGTIPSMSYKEALLQQSQKQIKGFALNEYKKSYIKFMNEAAENVIPENITYGELVEQYRDNNRSLGEYFEPGASKALNRAKKDVLLDQNRAIASVLEKTNPELSKVFKEGNERWSKIMDVEAIDNFVSDMFPENQKIDFKHMKEIFDDPNYQRIFKRSLGEEGAKSFELAIEDMLTAERPYKMMREAQSKGFGDLVLSAKAYLVSPKLGYAKAGLDAVRMTYRALFNATLDKPQVGLKFTKAVKELRTGDFKTAAKDFKAVEAEILPKEEASPKEKAKGETINAKAEKVETPKESQSKKSPQKQIEHKKPQEKTKPIHEMNFEETANEIDKLTQYDKKIIEPVVGKEVFEKEYKNQGFEGQRRFWDKYENLFSEKEIKQIEDYPYTIEDLRLKQNEFRDVRTSYNVGENPSESINNVIGEIRSSLINPKEAKNQSIIKEAFKFLEEKGHSKKEIAKEIFKVMKRDLSESDLNLVIKDLFENKKTKLDNAKEAKRVEALKKFNEKKKVEPKKKSAAQLAYEKAKKNGKSVNEVVDFIENKKESQKSLTKEKVKEVKHQDISKKGLKEQKSYLIEHLDKAIEKAPDIDISMKMKKGESAKEFKEKHNKLKELITFDVPGDGQFKIKNHKKALQQFRDSVEKRWPDKPMRKSGI